MAPHSSTLAWRIPWTEEPGGLQSWSHEESDTTERPHFHFSLTCLGEGNGNPLQCSCLENPRDGGAQWAAVYGVAQSWTRLNGFSSSSSVPVTMLRSPLILPFLSSLLPRVRKSVLCLHLHCCPANKFIDAIFLDSKCALIDRICLSLSDLLHAV